MGLRTIPNSGYCLRRISCVFIYLNPERPTAEELQTVDMASMNQVLQLIHFPSHPKVTLPSNPSIN